MIEGRPWIQNMAYVIQGWIINLIAIRKAVNPFNLQIDVNMMSCLKAMSIGMRVLPPALEILPTDQASINIQI